ncbi:MAG TPA: FAD-binding oxidoreductase [Jatrophihabitans sp.]|nr:FAD-binding oxidoreductase [Jatrophihabitans sp.]
MTDVPRPAVRTGAWREAIVRSVSHPNEHAVVLRLQVPDRIAHLPGQHYVIRLTAPDGYVAQRSYSIASAPSDDLLEFYIERLPHGEVSSFLSDIVDVGDVLDVRGPIGGWFVWDASTPMLGVAGGSGVVPFIAMLRHAREAGRLDLLRLAVSARTENDVPYAAELNSIGALVRLTRAGDGRLTPQDLAPLVPGARDFFVCGAPAFTSAAVSWLQVLGAPTEAIRIESFGPSG